MNSAMVYLNGGFISAADARIGVYDAGWLHGAGLFETMRAENGRVFRLEKHLDRLNSSADKLRIPVDRSRLPDPSVFAELLQRNGLQVARVRLTVSAGNVLDIADDDRRPVTVCVTASQLAPYPAAFYDTGLTVILSKYRQSANDPLAGCKTTNYLGRLVAMKDAGDVNCGEALWFNTRNMLAEGCISNVFIVKNGAVATPPIDTPVLPGIARAVVLEICAAESIAASERPIDVNNLLDADEVFLTNSVMQVMPVRAVERRPIAGGNPGPVVRRLLDAYRRLVERDCAAPNH